MWERVRRSLQSTNLTRTQKRYHSKLRENLSVLIVGSDVESLVCALAFKNKYKTNPTILDNTPLKFEQGLIIPINGQRILKKLGVDQEIEKKGTIIHQYIKLNDQGTEYGRIHYKQIPGNPKSNCVGIKKSELLKILEKSLSNSQPESLIKRNTKLISLKNVSVNGSLQVECEFFSEKEGKRKLNYDFVIGADGPISQVCELVWSSEEIIQKIHLGRYHTIIPREEGIPLDIYYEIWGNNNVLGCFPISATQCVVFLTFPRKNANTDLTELYTTVDYSEMLEKISSWKALDKAPFNIIVDSIKKEKPPVHLNYLIETVLSSPPVYHRIGLIGSSVVGFYPLLRGHDLGQAIEDSMTIAECITYPGIGIDLALRKYASVRSPRWDEVRKVSTTTTLTTHSNEADIRLKLKNFVAKLDNTTVRLLDKEKKLVGYGEHNTMNRTVDILKQ